MKMLALGGSSLQSVAIIAGGDSTRMGQAKALLPFHHTPLINWHVDQAHDLFKQYELAPNVLVCSHNHNYDAHIKSAYRCMPDKTDQAGNAVGPLGGIAGAMRDIVTEQAAVIDEDLWLMVLSVDSLIGAHQLFDFLIVECNRQSERSITDTEVIVLKSETRTYPLLGLYRLSVYEKLNAYIEQGERRVMTFLQQQNVKLMTMPKEWQASVNINTPEDLSAFEKRV